MSRKLLIIQYSLGSCCFCVVACASPVGHQRFAQDALLPIPNITHQQAGGTPPHVWQEPNSEFTPSPSVHLDTPLQIPPPSPFQSPLPSTPDITPTPPHIVIDGSEDGFLKADEQQTVHTAFLEDAHLVSIKGTQSLSASHSLSLPLKKEPRGTLNVYRARDASYGSFDTIGKASLSADARTATFAFTSPGDHLLAGEETYIPPSQVVVVTPDAVQESFEVEVDNQVLAATSLQTRYRRRIASTTPNLHVRNYLGRDPFVLQPVVLLLHGMDERDAPKLWRNITVYLRTKAANKGLFKGMPFFIPTYNSLNAVHVSKEWVKQQLFERFGSVPIILACHSMGCLVARDLAADPDVRDLVVGGVLLAGANLGSPWVPKKRTRPSLASQPDATTLLTAQTLALAKVMPNGIESPQITQSLSQLVQSFDEGLTSKGALTRVSLIVP